MSNENTSPINNLIVAGAGIGFLTGLILTGGSLTAGGLLLSFGAWSGYQFNKMLFGKTLAENIAEVAIELPKFVVTTLGVEVPKAILRKAARETKAAIINSGKAALNTGVNATKQLASEGVKALATGANVGINATKQLASEGVKVLATGANVGINTTKQLASGGATVLATTTKATVSATSTTLDGVGLAAMKVVGATKTAVDKLGETVGVGSLDTCIEDIETAMVQRVKKHIPETAPQTTRKVYDALVVAYPVKALDKTAQMLRPSVEEGLPPSRMQTVRTIVSAVPLFFSTLLRPLEVSSPETPSPVLFSGGPQSSNLPKQSEIAYAPTRRLTA